KISIEQPEPSTRLAACSAASGETPYPRPLRKTCSHSAACQESSPPSRSSFRRADISAVLNCSTNMCHLRPYFKFYRIRHAIPRFRCRQTTFFHYRRNQYQSHQQSFWLRGKQPFCYQRPRAASSDRVDTSTQTGHSRFHASFRHFAHMHIEAGFGQQRGELYYI